MNELNPALRSTVHVPVKSNGGFGRGFLRLSGARAPSGMTGISFPAGGFCCADVQGVRTAKKMAPASARAGLNPELPIFLTPLLLCPDRFCGCHFTNVRRSRQRSTLAA